MRVLLDHVYRASAALAAAFLALIAVLVVTQVAGRLVGLKVIGADDLAGFSLTASSFLALAPTLRRGGHIRVTLLFRGFDARRRRAFELWCLSVGTCIVGYFAYFVAEMAVESYFFREMAIGPLPVPLWIPRSGMALGLVILFVAVVDEFVQVLRTGEPSYKDDVATLAELEPLTEPLDPAKR